MIRREAIKIVSENLRKNPIVSANGFMSRDLFEVNDKESNFYMIGSMGLASSIGLGIALKNPKKRVFVFDGDGNILMNLGSLVTIGSMAPKNLVHIIFDTIRIVFWCNAYNMSSHLQHVIITAWGSHDVA